MAFKLINEGNKKSKQVWSGVCHQCDAVYECTGHDITHETFDQREAFSFSWEKCPSCGAGLANGYGGLLMYPKKITGE
jgi:hypothetical protein